MKSQQYQYMFEAEDHHWWYVGNREIFINILRSKNILKNSLRLLDAGCGTGGWLHLLKKSYNIIETGIDNHEIALDYAKSRPVPLNLVCGDINTYAFEKSSFDLITSFDVIYHREVNDELAVKNFHTCLKKNGHLLLTVPAYSFLFSRHDEVVHARKRYTKKQVRHLMENNGFEVVKISYCVCLLFPVALIKRLFDKIFSARDTEHNEVRLPSPFVNRIFLSIMLLENSLLKHFSLPFGLSVLVLAKKTVKVSSPLHYSSR